MTPDDIRRYQVYLLENRKLAVGTVVGHVGALRQGVGLGRCGGTLKESEMAETFYDRYVLLRERIGNDDSTAPPTLLVRAILSRKSPRSV